MQFNTKKTVISALMAALVCVATMIVKIPSPMKGYLNLGDCAVLVSAWILSPVYGFLAAGVGSALADLFSGYVLYAPATFLIKGAMAPVAFFAFALLGKRMKELPARLIAAALAELVMILGYYLFEGVLYGFIPSLVNVPANAVQGVAGMILGVLLLKGLHRAGIGKQ